ncbi:MAG: hypothetical protein AAF412_09185 [Pseudomonadota bacterium]
MTKRDFSASVQYYLTEYERNFSAFKETAGLAKALVTELTKSMSATLHTVTSRAKSPESLRSKIRTKGYRKPESQVMDLIGVRVITFYHDDVSSIVRLLKKTLDVNEAESIDKRAQLGLREFGYRSVQIIARLKPHHQKGREYEPLYDQWFEIQIRSILEHAWAEIEHEVVYKSKVDYPREIVRRFASLAGTLEILDDEFFALKHKKNDLIRKYRDFYRKNREDKTPFDTARLLGFLEATRSKGRSWRRAEEEGRPFHPGLDSACIDALRAVGLDSPKKLNYVLTSRKFRYGAATFASARGIETKHISHPACVVVALIVTDASTIKRYFPEVVLDQTVAGMIESRS